MPLHHNSCADDREPSICNHERNCERPPDDRSASCDAGSRVSVRDSNLMIKSAPRENPATVGSVTLGSSSCPGADLHINSLHAINRLDESLLNSRHQSRMIFSSSAAAVDHERGFLVAGGWSPRCYACSFCGREFNSAQALGGHMNIHRRDRARLRTSSTSAPTSLPHQPDLAPILPNTPQSAHANLYNTFEAVLRESPTTISSSLNTYTPPAIISAAPTFRLFDMHPPADPALAAYPSQDENGTAPFSVPLGDLLPFCSTRSSCATRFSKVQNEAHALFPNIAPHASPLPIRENSSIKRVEALNICSGLASTQHAQVSLDCEASGGAQLIQFSHSKGRVKRARGDALDTATASSNSTGQRSDVEQPFTEKSNVPLHAAADAASSCVRPTPHIKGLLCLDLELRLGQSSPSDSRATSSTTGGEWTTAPRPP